MMVFIWALGLFMTCWAHQFVGSSHLGLAGSLHNISRDPNKVDIFPIIPQSHLLPSICEFNRSTVADLLYYMHTHYLYLRNVLNPKDNKQHLYGVCALVGLSGLKNASRFAMFAHWWAIPGWRKHRVLHIYNIYIYTQGQHILYGHIPPQRTECISRCTGMQHDRGMAVPGIYPWAC